MFYLGVDGPSAADSRQTRKLSETIIYKQPNGAPSPESISVPVSFAMHPPTRLSLSRDTDASVSTSASASRPGSFKNPTPRRLRGSERDEEARTRRVDSSSDEEDGEERDEPVTAFDRLSGASNERSDLFFSFSFTLA